MKDLERFATSKLSEEGVEIPLTDVEGKPTEHWITIRGTDSKPFKKAQAKFRRRVLALQEMDDSLTQEKNTELIEKETRELLSSLVVSWSFKNDDGSNYPCTKSNIIKVLQDAPILCDEIDTASARRANFIQRSLPKSQNTQENNSSSKKPRKIAKSAS